MQYFLKYLTSAPIMAALTMAILAGVLIELNLFFPGLQYGTYFHSVP
ncbi:photosystem I reaction center subunit IX [Altericista sp. CCNU0014]